MLEIKYDTDVHAILRFEVIDADDEGIEFDRPFLKIRDDASGETFCLDHDAARRLKLFLQRAF